MIAARHAATGRVERMQSDGPDLWEAFVEEASGFAIYGLDAPAGELGAVFENLEKSARTESDPVIWRTDEGVLQVTLRVLRNVGARRDDMVAQAVVWILDNTEAEDHLSKLRLTYRLAEAKVLMGLVNHPPIEGATDARFQQVVRLTEESRGFVFNGIRFRSADGTDLAWAVSPAQPRRRGRGSFRRGSRRPKGRA